MRKSFLILFSVYLFLPLIVLGQDQIVFKFGLTQANISGENVTDDYESKGGLALGASFLTKMNGSFYLESELMYTENGYSREFYDVYLNYYNISLLFKLYSEGLIQMPIERMSVFALAGPNLALLINSAIEDIRGNTYSTGQELYDFGLIFGAGLGYLFDFGNLSFEVRYNLGFINTILNENIDDQNEKIEKNRSWLFLLGYSIDIND